jgi:hypothetical protein
VKRNVQLFGRMPTAVSVSLAPAPAGRYRWRGIGVHFGGIGTWRLRLSSFTGGPPISQTSAACLAEPRGLVLCRDRVIGQMVRRFIRSRISTNAADIRTGAALVGSIMAAAGGSAVAMAKIDERIEALETRLRQLKVQHQRREARARTVAARRARGAELRRKILVGAIVLAKVEEGVLDEAVLRGWLDAALTREDDRALFELAQIGP